MILVVADDISGAAELAGAAHGRGLSAHVRVGTGVGEESADVVALDLQTRSLSRAEARRRARRLVRSLERRPPARIYHKTDSVLRGNVPAEAEALAEGLGRRRILLVPANPARGRRIVDGEYLVGGTPLHRTLFARDPEHPRTASRALECLSGAAGWDRLWVGRGDPSPLRGLVVPDVHTEEDLEARAGEADEGTLPCGAVEFFQALLSRWAGVRTPRPSASESGGGARLMVSGSLAAWERGIAERAARHGAVVALPRMRRGWRERALRKLRAGGTVLLALGGEPLPPGRRGTVMLARAAEELAGRAPVERLLVEGGATASALFRRMGWSRFESLPSGGAPALRPLPPHQPIRIQVKPGSYPWPEGVWRDC